MIMVKNLDMNLLIEASNKICNARVGKLMERLEEILKEKEIERGTEIHARIRKAVLDEMNELRRQILREIIR